MPEDDVPPEQGNFPDQRKALENLIDEVGIYQYLNVACDYARKKEQSDLFYQVGWRWIGRILRNARSKVFSWTHQMGQ